jgi:hypothetical protein
MLRTATVTVDVQNVYVLLLNLSILKHMGLAIRVAVMAHQTPVF